MKIGLGIGIPFIRNYVSSIVFDPSKLFTGSTNGVWYDPSDTTTLYRDAAGTQPVTAVEQPVGLMLDKSKGLVLGPELVTNGGFDTNLNGWTPQATVTASRDTSIFPSGALKLQVTSAASTYVEQSLGSNFVPGRKYKATATVYTSSTTPAGAGAAISFVNSGFTSTTSVAQSQKDTAQTLTIYFTATNTTHSIYLAVCTLDFVGWGAVGSVAYFDNISVRELPGNHAFNSSGNSANFPVLSARYNLLTKTEDFSDAGWRKSDATAPNAYTLQDTATANFHYVDRGNTLPFTSGVSYTFKVRLEKGTIGFAGIHIYDNTPRGCSVDLVTGQIGTPYGGATATSVADGTGWILTVTATAGATTSTGSAAIYTSTSNALVSYTGTGTGTILVSKADLRVANDALNQPAYQRVNTATDYDTVGFKPYLRFNGTNQWLQTNSIDFTYGDKMFVSAGVRNGGQGFIFEFSANADSQIGSFVVVAASATYTVQARGTNTGYYTPGTYAAPITNVVSGVFDIAGSALATEVIPRVNGVVNQSGGAGGCGTGNFGNYPLYIGARAGTSLWFNGRLYSLIVAGKLANAVEITETEKYVNGKTAAY